MPVALPARGFVFLLSLFVLAAGLAPLPLRAGVFAQDAGTASAASPATPVATAPAAVAAIDIPARADRDERFAQDVIARARAGDITAALEPRLLALQAAVREQQGLLRDRQLKLLPTTRLESIERHWRFFERQYQAWSTDLAEAGAPALDDAAALGERRDAWQATRAADQDNSLSPALRDRIVSVQVQLDAAQRALSKPLDRQIRLGQRGLDLEAAIQAGRKTITAAIAYSDSRLGRVDAPPLWQLSPDTGSDGALASLKTGLDAETAFLTEYSAANHLSRRAYNYLMLLLLPVLLWLSRRSRRHPDDDLEAQPSLRVLRRPFATWLLLATTGVVVFEPEAPILLHQCMLFLALVPVLRLLPARVYAVLGPWPYVVSGLYLLSLLDFLFLANAFAHRVYLLAVTVLALALVAWLLWRSLRAPVAGAVGTVLRVAGRLALATLTVSAAANVFGNVSLAEMLTGALLFSAYLGLVVFAGANVLTSLLRLGLTHPATAQLPLLSRHGRTFLRGVSWLLRLLALIGWLVIALNQFRLLRPVHAALSSVLGHPFSFGQLTITPGNVLAFAFSVLLAFWAAKTVRLLLHDDILPTMSLPRGVANSAASLTYYAVLILGLLVALAAAGFQVGQLALVIGALGVGIGLGLQSVVNNFVSGLILMFERPIQPGDIIEVTGTTGKVREIGMRATTLTTFEGADVVVPNGSLLSEKLINWTLSNMNRRIELPVGVAYGSDPRRVMALLLEAARGTTGVTGDPEPAVLFEGFGASSLDFLVRVWTTRASDWVPTRSELALRVNDALAEAGIEIPFPQQDLHLRSVSEQARQALAPEPPSGRD